MLVAKQHQHTEHGLWEVLGASVLHTHTGVLGCLMFPAASDGNITPNVLRLHHYRPWDRGTPRGRMRYENTQMTSLLNHIPEKEVETLFPSHSKLTVRPQSLLCASGAVRGRKEGGLQDLRQNLHCTTDLTDWPGRSEDASYEDKGLSSE